MGCGHASQHGHGFRFATEGRTAIGVTVVVFRIANDVRLQPPSQVAPVHRHAGMGGESGYDWHRKIKGQKRNTVVDTLGMILAVVVTAADADEAKAAPLVLNSWTASVVRD